MNDGMVILIGVSGAVMAAVLLWTTRSDELISHKWAKIRVRIDETRRRGPELPENRYTGQGILEWLVYGGLLLLMLILLASRF